MINNDERAAAEMEADDVCLLLGRDPQIHPRYREKVVEVLLRFRREGVRQALLKYGHHHKGDYGPWPCPALHGDICNCGLDTAIREAGGA